MARTGCESRAFVFRQSCHVLLRQPLSAYVTYSVDDIQIRSGI